MKGLIDFLSRGDVLNMAVGIIIGGAFGAIVSSLVADVLMPIIGMIVGSPDFSGLTAGPILIGNFITAVVNFILIGTAVYFFLVKPLSKPEPEPAPPGPSDVDLLTEIRDLLAKN